MQRQIDLLYSEGEDAFWAKTGKFNAAAIPEIKAIALPSNPSAALSIFKMITRLLREFLNRVFYFDGWFLLFSFNKDVTGGLGTFDRLIPPKSSFWADPHAVQVNGINYIFIEEFSRTKNKGHISVIEMDEIGKCKAPVKVLEKDYHLSYPSVFNWQGKYYLIPESGENRTIDLYQCVEFPYVWEYKQNLMKNITAVDTTPIYYRSKWWLFTAMAENEAAAPNVELFLFYADDLFTRQWTAHPQNPIVSDVKSARPAGDLFMRAGKLFRPSQDCSKAYGYGFDLNEIEVLSETEYCERKTLSVRPDWDEKILATHTYAKQGNLTVIDAFSRRFKWARTA